MPGLVVCGEAGWVRRFAALAVPLGVFVPGLPLFLFLLPERGTLHALLASGVLGLLSAYLLLGRALMGHQAAHQGEAERLGYMVRPLSSPFAPLSWSRRGLPLALEGRGSEADLRLIRGFGPLHDSCEAEEVTRRELESLAVVSLILDGLLLPVFGLPLWMRAALFAAAAAAASVLALQALQSVLPRFSREEGGPDPSAGRYWSWPFYRLWLQRRRQRSDPALRRDFRLVLRAAAGVRSGHLKLELGSGAGVLRGFSPERLRRGWVQADMDALALHWVRSRDAGARQACADAAALPFREATFDRVLTLTFFDAVFPERRDAALAEAYRVLKPGGVLLHLQDFSDWPGPALLERSNLLLSRLGGSVRLKSGKPFSQHLVVPGLEEERRTRLRRALADLEVQLIPALADEARWLRLAFSRGAANVRRMEDPRLAFLYILRRGLVRQGFDVLPPSPALRGALKYCVYLAARKPG